ncbi:MAG: Vitamin B12 dependent methionine synthase activation subunit [Clostridia bacterium]|nr:Vitamin B12 dependent methionine synthase activation subunit [Clostridia bacterium]
MIPVFTGRIEGEAIALDPREAALRLGCPADTVAIADECLAELKEALLCRYAYCRLPVTHPQDGITDLGFGTLPSSDLIKNLQDCHEAFLLAVTLGTGVDRLLLRLSRLSPARHFVTDALASALAEAACDLAEEVITGGIPCRPRYSPGYGDLSLAVQPAILQTLNAEKLLGITMSDTLLMSPTKTITCIIGIKP